VSQAVSAARSPLVAHSPEAVTAALEVVEEALIRSTHARSLLWVIDDAQWLDERTLELLLMLADRAARSAAKGRLLVLLTALGSGGGAWQKLAQHPAFRQQRGARSVPLSLLSAPSAALVARNVAPFDDNIVERVVGLAGGVPRFVVQSLLGWYELGQLTWEGGS